MNSIQRELLFKSWSSINEIALVKEVATKGEFVDLCLEYLSTKKNIPLEKSSEFFHEIVDTYVYRLLNDKLLFKAENVLRNVRRDYKSIFYQFAFESTDEAIKTPIFDHLKKSNPEFEAEKLRYEFYLNILRETQKETKLQNYIRRKLKVLNLENFLRLDDYFQKSVIIKLYFYTKNDELLNHLTKKDVWEYLVNENFDSELVLWCRVQKGEDIEHKTTLSKNYSIWEIDDGMFMYAIKNLQTSSESLRDLFVFYSKIFDDEKHNVQKILERVFRTESFEKNESIIKDLPIAEYIVQKECYTLLLEDFVTLEDLERLKTVYNEKIEFFDLIITLKTCTDYNVENYLKISQASTKFLEKEQNNYLESHPLVALSEFIIADKDIKTLKDDNSREANIIKSIPFISDLLLRLGPRNIDPSIVDPHELLKQSTGIDLKEMSKEFGDEPASFSNSHMIAKYGKKYKLNYLNFIKQERSSYAVYKFFLEQLTNYSQIGTSQLFNAVESVTDLALSNHKNENLLTHCIAFIEQLGFNSQNLRSVIKLLSICNDLEMKVFDFKILIETAEEKLFGDTKQMEQIYESNSFPIEEYSAIMRVAKLSGQKIWPEKYLNFLAQQNDWWKLLLFIQYFDIPIYEIKKICKNFSIPVMGGNFLRGVRYAPVESNCKNITGSLGSSTKRRSSFTRQKSRSKTESQSITSGETGTSSVSSSNAAANNEKESSTLFKSNTERQLKLLEESDDLDLFALIILCTTTIPEERITMFSRFLEIMKDSNSYSTSFNLMKKCVEHQLPILSVLSTTLCNQNIDWNWLVWLSVSIDKFKMISEIPLKNSNEIGIRLIEEAVRDGCVRTLHKSFIIFFENKFSNLTKFLKETIELNFNEDCIIDLRLYFLGWSNEELSLPFAELTKEQLMFFTVKILILHLDNNFRSKYYQHKFLQIISQSGMADFVSIIDFILLCDVFELTIGTDLEIDFEQLIPSSIVLVKKNIAIKQYLQLLDTFQDAKEYDKAIKLATLLNQPLCDIIYTKWISQLDLNENHFNFQQYENDTDEHSLSPEFLVNFYLYAALQFDITDYRRYLMYKNSLDTIKKNRLFPNESFDRDEIEMEMILCFLQNDRSIDDTEMYHSEYFEEILQHERCVLYKSFMELKELAGIEDLTTSLKNPLTTEMQLKLEKLLDRLLDKGDIVEALRLQAMFEYPTVDLRYLVFCMALAEGLTTIYNLSDEERLMFASAEKRSSAKFDKRTLERRKAKEQQMFAAIRQSENFASNLTLEFEEIPPKEKQQILDALQGMASSLKYGVNLGKRIVMVYRAAMYLDKDYLDVLRTKDTLMLLKSATNEDCLKKLLVINDIFTSSQMTALEIAEFLAQEIATAVVRPVFYLLNAGQQNINQTKDAILWGYDLDREFHLILEICPKSNLLGESLLEYCDILKVYRRYQDNEEYEYSVIFEKFHDIIKMYGLPNVTTISSLSATQQVLSHKKQNTLYVELLIIAHECFVHECSMEGIVDVLNRAKALNTILATAKSWILIVRMLTGIGRYREMFYCFDTLIKNDQFEFLLGQFDEQRTKGLRYAIISYLREFCPQNQENMKLVALHFLMHKELAEMWERDANLNISKVLANYHIAYSRNDSVSKMDDTLTRKDLISKLKCSSQALDELRQVLEDLSQSTEYYLLDNKIRLAEKNAARAQLVAMQIDLMNKSLNSSCCGMGTDHLCICVINICTKEEFREIINSEIQRIPQVLILSRAYPDYDINWAEVILWQYVILNRINYFEEYKQYFEITDAIIDNIVKGFQLHSQTVQSTTKMEENLLELVKLVQSITLKYKLASLLSFKKLIVDMLNDERSIYYLKDTDYGRNEIDLPEG